MAFVKKVWKDRVSEYPTRRLLTNVDTSEETYVTVARSEGIVSENGDAFSATNMNDLEDRIEDAFEGGGSGGGHVIKNQSGTDVAQEPNMKFADMHVSDDPVNQTTIIERMKVVTAQQFENLPTDGSADGEYEISSGQGSVDSLANLIGVRCQSGYIQCTTDGGITWKNIINVNTPQQLLPVMQNNTSAIGTASANGGSASGSISNAEAYLMIDSTSPNLEGQLSSNDAHVTFTFTDITFVRQLTVYARKTTNDNCEFSMDYMDAENVWHGGTANTVNSQTSSQFTQNINNNVKAVRVRKRSSVGNLYIKRFEAWN